MADVERLVAPHAREVQEATKDLCRFVEEVVDGAEARVDEHAIDYRLDRPFCTVSPTKGHVTFMFTDGARLHDPDGLLEGDGPSRHIKVRAFGDIDLERAVRWLNQAERLARADPVK